VIVAAAPSGRIELTNDQAEAMLRRRPQADRLDAYGIPGFDEHGRSLEPKDWPLSRALLTGESVRDERIRVERDDGSFLTLEANASPIRDAKGGISAAVVVFWDVSEREQRERAEREFITNAAHQLQTPVASIVSAVEVLVGGAKDDPEDRERFLGHLERESSRLVRILRSLLVLARTQLAGESVELAPVALRPLLDAIALDLQPARGVEIVVRSPAGLTVLSNGDLLEQAVGNLAGNSARHTARGRIVLSAARTRDGLRIEVADSGPGIDPADVERLFQRFARGTEVDSNGFGLGLAIVRQAVTALGGEISLAPRRGGGTVARIVLPEPGKEEA
jgi:two-component system phosphate regulon sensor histidine kinase PhoR